jgi:hypothetical protein
MGMCARARGGAVWAVLWADRISCMSGRQGKGGEKIEAHALFHLASCATAPTAPTAPAGWQRPRGR